MIAIVTACLNPCFSGTYSRRATQIRKYAVQRIVLILVLVEHTLGEAQTLFCRPAWYVLILVLVEHTLGVYSPIPISMEECCLNPCFSGTYSRRGWQKGSCTFPRRLNPCFSGTYSRRKDIDHDRSRNRGLNPCFSGTYSRRG